MKRFLLGILCAILFGVSPVYAAGIVEREVEVTGSGPTRDKAVNDGLAQAVGQVTGLHLSAEDVISTAINIEKTEESIGEKLKTDSLMGLNEDQRRNITTKTRGQVKSYRILREQPSSTIKGNVEVLMTVVVAYFDIESSTKRKRIAVMPFRMLSGNDAEQLFVRQLNDSITQTLTQTRNFAVLDRAFLREKHAEFDFLQGDDIKVEERARVGATIGTDYLLVGRVTNFYAKETTEKVPYSNTKGSYIKGKVSLTWRLIDVPTGMVVASDIQDKKIRIKNENEGWGELIAAFARPAGHEIARNITNIIYPTLVVAHRDGVLTIANGGSNMKVGQHYHLVRYGEVLMDPYTGEALAREEIRIGEVEIVDVAPKISHARIVSCSETIGEIQPRQYILRPNTTDKKTNGTKPAPRQTPKW